MGHGVTTTVALGPTLWRLNVGNSTLLIRKPQAVKKSKTKPDRGPLFEGDWWKETSPHSWWGVMELDRHEDDLVISYHPTREDAQEACRRWNAHGNQAFVFRWGAGVHRSWE